jgi:hypothetical protein
VYPPNFQLLLHLAGRFKKDPIDAEFPDAGRFPGHARECPKLKGRKPELRIAWLPGAPDPSLTVAALIGAMQFEGSSALPDGRGSLGGSQAWPNSRGH